MSSYQSSRHGDKTELRQKYVKDGKERGNKESSKDPDSEGKQNNMKQGTPRKCQDKRMSVAIRK